MPAKTRRLRNRLPARLTPIRFAKPTTFAFAKDSISLPGNAAVEGNDFLPPSAFPDARYCGHCHKEAYHQWRQALHSNSFRTPFYRQSVNILTAHQGRGIRAPLR